VNYEPARSRGSPDLAAETRPGAPRSAREQGANSASPKRVKIYGSEGAGLSRKSMIAHSMFPLGKLPRGRLGSKDPLLKTAIAGFQTA